MAKKKKPIEELDLEEAINVVKRLSKPDRPNEELELLKKASSTLLNEVQPGFEFEEDEDGGSSAVQEELTKAPGFVEQIGAQAAALGPAGLIALASAAYFQVDTVVEETRVVQQVAEEKWEEVKLEHPNINWDDPLAGFTTIIGMGDIEIDLDPPASSGSTGNTPSDDTTKGKLNGSTTVSEESGESGEEGSQETDSKENDTDNEPNEDSKEEPVEEEKEEPKKKKKGLFSKLLGGDDEEEAEEAEEESEPEPEAEAEEAKESEEESNEPEPEAEEQVEEKPKKKKGFFSFLTGGGDDDDEPDSEEQGEPTQEDGDTIPDEQTEEESTTESEAETSEGEVDGTEQAGNTEANADTAESNGIESKKSSGGGLLSLFGINSNEKEVVEQGEISTDEEPAIEIAEVDSETEAPPISTEPEVEVEVEDISIDGIDDIKPHAMVAQVEVEVEPKVEINIADIVVNADVVVDDILIDPGIEIAAIDNIIEETVIEAEELPLVITPNEGITVVSPSNQLYASTNIF